jgi:hypothetical protein
MKLFLITILLAIIAILVWPSRKQHEDKILTKDHSLGKIGTSNPNLPLPDEKLALYGPREGVTDNHSILRPPLVGPERNVQPSSSVVQKRDLAAIPNENRYHLTAGIDAVVSPVAPNQRGSTVGSVISVVSQYPDEPTIAFSTLSGSCSSLEELNFAVALRVGPDGFVKEAAPLDTEDVSIPPTVYNCQFGGGPANNFITTYYPLQWRRNP